MITGRGGGLALQNLLVCVHVCVHTWEVHVCIYACAYLHAASSVVERVVFVQCVLDPLLLSANGESVWHQTQSLILPRVVELRGTAILLPSVAA